MKRFWTYYEAVLKVFTILGSACLVGMVALTCTDVVGRWFKHPLFGSIELVSILATLSISFAMPYTHKEKGHIGVEILVRLLSDKVQAVIGLCTGVLSMGLFSIVTWRMYLYAVSMKNSGEVSTNLEFPFYLVIYAISACFLVLFLQILQDLLKSIKALKGTQ